jgi:regulator of cell morphogenesis and NO signaling
MNIRQDTEVRSIVMDDPAMSLVFEQVGIDYYCDSARKSLAEACEDGLLSVEQVLDRLNELKRLRASRSNADRFPFDPQTAPVARIVEHIVNKYHADARRDIPRIRKLAETVRRHYAGSHPELVEVERVYRVLSDDLEHHMYKEEQALFPSFIGRKRTLQGDMLFLGSVHKFARSIYVIKAEHQDCEDMLVALRSLTDDYAPMQDGCPADRALYQGLEQFELDTREHLYLEDNVLFPRVLQDEQPGSQGLNRGTGEASIR